MGSVCVCVSMWISFHKMLTKEGGQAGQSLSSCQFFTNIAIYILHLIQLVLFTRMPVFVFLLSILIYVKISAVTLFQLVYLNLVQPTFTCFNTTVLGGDVNIALRHACTILMCCQIKQYKDVYFNDTNKCFFSLKVLFYFQVFKVVQNCEVGARLLRIHNIA